MALYDDLVSCESSPEAPGLACAVLYPEAIAEYPSLMPWDLLGLALTCPPGPEPTPPGIVIDRGLMAVAALGTQMTEEATQDWARYVEERWEQHHDLWQYRVKLCGLRTEPPKPGQGETPGPTPQTPPETEPPHPAVAKADYGTAFLIVMAGLGLIAAARK